MLVLGKQVLTKLCADSGNLMVALDRMALVVFYHGRQRFIAS